MTKMALLCHSLFMKWVGLTGGIASGKTTVANILKEKGIPVIDADRLAHRALKLQQDKIVTYFGPEILTEDKQIDRSRLAEKVFSSEKHKKALEALVHPLVQDRVQEKKRLFEVAGHDLAVYDVPLLYENGLQEGFDQVVVVYIPESLSLERLMQRNQISEEQAKSRIANQMNIETKKKMADVVISNEGDQEALRKEVLDWLDSIKE